MEQTRKFYTQWAISVATYFGGPLAAAYLVKKNYDSLDQTENGKKALVIGIVSTLLLFAGIFSIPEPVIDKIPRALIPLVYTALIYWIVEKLQGPALKQHKETGGEFHSGWKAAGVGAISMLIILVTIGSIAFIAGDLSATDFDTVTYNKESEKFQENEKKALAVFDVIETQTSDYLIKELNAGTNLWKQNIAIVKGLEKIKNLPDEMLDQNALLLKYCELRIKYNDMLIKAISENTDKYLSEIEKVGSEINKVLSNLNQLK